jgi:hypothetical protein
MDIEELKANSSDYYYRHQEVHAFRYSASKWFWAISI